MASAEPDSAPRFPRIPPWLRPGLVLCFLGLALALAFSNSDGRVGNVTLLLIVALAGAYLALNIGANDAANHIGMAVGSGAVRLGAALVIATAAELAGAYLAGAPVSERLQGLLQPDALGHGVGLTQALLSGMLAGGLWLNLATALRIPVSTTHAVIGGLLGAGIAAHGWLAVQWVQVVPIAVVWILSPAAAALMAGAVLHLAERAIVQQPNLLGAARIRVPLLLALLSMVMADYLFMALAPLESLVSHRPLVASLTVAAAAFLIAQPSIHRLVQTIKGNRQGLNRLFTLPLILAAAFFAFAHGANDVANVAAPLAEVVRIAVQGGEPPGVGLPAWTLAIGALGIAVGIAAYGSPVVQTIGSDLTDIDKLRAFCVALAAALVVVTASHFGFPVSTTHTVVGAVVGVGLLRELTRRQERKTLEKIRKCHAQADQETLVDFLGRFQGATLKSRREMLDELYREHGPVVLTAEEQRGIHTLYHRRLVQRELLWRILLFWVLTIPISALLGGLLYRLSGLLTG